MKQNCRENKADILRNEIYKPLNFVGRRSVYNLSNSQKLNEKLIAYATSGFTQLDRDGGNCHRCR